MEAATDDDPRFTARLPIAQYALTDRQSAAIDAAVDTLTEHCMRRYGLAYRAPRQPAPPAERSADRRYGLSSAFDAAHYGYHLTPAEESPQTPPESARAGSAQYLVLFGSKDGRHPDVTTPVAYQGHPVPQGGCRGQAVSGMAGRYDDPSAAKVASDIAEDSYTASTKDPAVRKATRAWSACMKKRGYTYSTPMAALGDKAFLAGRTPSAREVATAQADMACKDATDLLTTWFSAESRIQRGMIASQQAVLTRLRMAHTAWAAAAQKITSGA